MIAGFASTPMPGENGETQENTGEKQRKLTPEQEAELAKLSEMADNQPTNFDALSDMPPFPGAVEAGVAGALATAPLEIADNIAQQPTETAPEESGQTANANGEAQTTPASVVEQVAQEHTQNGSPSPDNIYKDAAGQIGREAVENTNVDVNLTIAQNVAENINPQKTDGTDEALNLLTETEAAAAVAKATAEGAALDAINGSLNATTSKAEAEELITKAESATTTLESAAGRVQAEDPTVTTKIVDGTENIRRSLQESRDMLTTAVDNMAAEQEAAENTEESSTSGEATTNESSAGAESVTAIGATPGANGDILNSTPTGNETTNVAPGELNASSIKAMQEQREKEKREAVENAMRAKNESAPQEQLEGHQSL